MALYPCEPGRPRSVTWRTGLVRKGRGSLCPFKANEKEGLMDKGRKCLKRMVCKVRGFDIINYFSEIMVKYLAKDQ